MARRADCYWRGLSVTDNVERSEIRVAVGCSCSSKPMTSPVTTSYTQRGIRFVEKPRHEPYGIVAVFEDLYGNRWDLIEPVTVTR